MKYSSKEPCEITQTPEPQEATGMDIFRGQRIKIVEGGDTTASNQGPLLGFGAFEKEMPKVEIDQNQMRQMQCLEIRPTLSQLKLNFGNDETG